jgi:DNA-binding XRE family transcriptional regulator
MDRAQFIAKADDIVRLVRQERGYTQDRMAEILGLSKKTLIQIEKGRASLGWSGAVVLCAVFSSSPIIDMSYGGSTSDLILSLAFGATDLAREKTLGGHVWWHELERAGDFRIQQNVVSGHYRILDRVDRRICSSFDPEFIRRRFTELQEISAPSIQESHGST